jgi:hypothetical protein
MLMLLGSYTNNMQFPEGNQQPLASWLTKTAIAITVIGMVAIRLRGQARAFHRDARGFPAPLRECWFQLWLTLRRIETGELSIPEVPVHHHILLEGTGVGGIAPAYLFYTTQSAKSIVVNKVMVLHEGRWLE